MNDNSLKIVEVDINEILPNRFQPRIHFDEEEILELSDSIKEHGVIQPIVVRTIGDKYEIIAGERRYKASVLAGKETVPVIIKNLNDKDSAEIALIENIQRKNLTPIEEALSYKKILDMGYLTQDSLAVKLGKSQPSVANKIRLLNLSDEVQEALLENKISERHARSLLKLKSLVDQNNMLTKIISERLTVRKTDEEIAKVLNNKEEKGELNMNNEINQGLGINNQNQTNNFFDIFGTNGSIEPIVPKDISSVPVFEPMTQNQVFPTPLQNNTEVKMEQPGEYQFDANKNVIATTEELNPVNLETQKVPVFEPMTQNQVFTTPLQSNAEVKMEQPGEYQFDANKNVIATTNGVEEYTTNYDEEKLQFDSVPQTAPIMTDTTINSSTEVPGPIIITDYSKQYEPLMPQQTHVIPEKVDFKEIINIIRDCSNRIEKFGYKIELDEYDLTNLYQVVIKIEK